MDISIPTKFALSNLLFELKKKKMMNITPYHNPILYIYDARYHVHPDNILSTMIAYIYVYLLQ